MTTNYDSKSLRKILIFSILNNGMSSKTAVMIGMSIGSIAGGYAPVFFGFSAFSFVSIITSAIGGLLGIFIAFRLTE